MGATYANTNEEFDALEHKCEFVFSEKARMREIVDFYQKMYEWVESDDTGVSGFFRSYFNNQPYKVGFVFSDYETFFHFKLRWAGCAFAG